MQSQVGTSPAGRSQGRTATDPQRWVCPGAAWGASVLPGSTEQTVRTSACSRTAENSARGPPRSDIISNYKFTFKTFTYFLKTKLKFTYREICRSSCTVWWVWQMFIHLYNTPVKTENTFITSVNAHNPWATQFWFLSSETNSAFPWITCLFLKLHYYLFSPET